MGNLLVVRKRADKTGERPVITPAREAVAADGTVIRTEAVYGAWPLLGVELVDAPEACSVPTSWVNKAVAEGWVTLEGARSEIRPGGPLDDLGKVTHHFIHADTLVIHTLDGDVRYRVTHQPDKYAADGGDDTPVSTEDYATGNTRVDWFYGLEREA